MRKPKRWHFRKPKLEQTVRITKEIPILDITTNEMVEVKCVAQKQAETNLANKTPLVNRI
jgi:hypothetical protein